MRHSKLLIVGTVPYNKNMTSRAFDAYFHNWEKENIAQIFSNTKKPLKGHCGTLFQITDQMLLKRHFNKKTQVGKIYNYEDLDLNESAKSNEYESGLLKKLYAIGHHKTPIIYLLRGILWKKRYWCNKELEKWIDDFHPECIFLSFSDDFFIPKIALHIAEKYNIPIISSIGDDYYFGKKFSLSPFYYIYKWKYKKCINKVFAHQGSAIFISDKIRDKYNSEFNLNGETIYLTSEIEREPFKIINKKSPVISYFGNICYGRNYLLDEIGTALGNINENYILNVYSNENDPKVYSILQKNKNISYNGQIPYNEVLTKMKNSDILIIVEGYSKEDIVATKYSLSTKVADYLASGINIFTYGSLECGVIEYMKSTNASMVCTNKVDLEKDLKELIDNQDTQKDMYNNAKIVYEKNHTLEANTKRFEELVSKNVDKYSSSLSDRLTLTIHTCQKFSDLWDSHVALLNKNWSDRNLRTMLVSDEKNNRKFENVELVCTGKGKEMSDRMGIALRDIHTKYVLVTLDDYFPIYKIDNNKILRLINIMEKENIDYICLFSKYNNYKKFKNYKNLYEIDLNNEYAVNLCAGIWRKDFLEKTANTSLNAWEYEVSMTKIARQYNAKCVLSKGNEFKTLDVIRKGKILTKANKYFKKNNISIGNREVMKKKDEIILEIRTVLKKILPKKITNILKKHLRKKGFVFFSD